MLRITFLLASLVFSTAAAADQSRGDPMKVFETYAVFVVANTNCLGLNFNVDNLQVELFNLGGKMNWSSTRRRQQTEAQVAASTLQYGQIRRHSAPWPARWSPITAHASCKAPACFIAPDFGEGFSGSPLQSDQAVPA